MILGISAKLTSDLRFLFHCTHVECRVNVMIVKNRITVFVLLKPVKV